MMMQHHYASSRKSNTNKQWQPYFVLTLSFSNKSLCQTEDVARIDRTLCKCNMKINTRCDTSMNILKVSTGGTEKLTSPCITCHPNNATCSPVQKQKPRSHYIYIYIYNFIIYIYVYINTLHSILYRKMYIRVRCQSHSHSNHIYGECRIHVIVSSCLYILYKRY